MTSPPSGPQPGDELAAEEEALLQPAMNFPPRTERPKRSRPGPWGILATLAWTLVLGAMMFLSGVLGGVVYIGWQIAWGRSLPSEMELASQLGQNGDFFWISLFIQTALCGVVLFGAVLLRWPYPVGEYLGFRPVRLRSCFLWSGILLLYNLVAEALFYFFDLPPPAWMEEVHASAEWLAGLILGVVVFAPLIEEMIFRGFIYDGVEKRAGPFWAGAAAVIPWVLLHLQYEHWYHLAVIFGLGLIFTLARWRTRSIVAPIFMHLLNNLLATLQMALSG